LQLLKEFNQGDLNIREFCELKKISRATFHKWKSRYKRNARIKARQPGFSRVQIIESPGYADKGLFAEVNGIRLYQIVAASYLKELCS